MICCATVCTYVMYECCVVYDCDGMRVCMLRKHLGYVCMLCVYAVYVCYVCVVCVLRRPRCMCCMYVVYVCYVCHALIVN